MATLTKEQFLAAAGVLKCERLTIPELGGEIIVREFTALERDQYEESLLRPELVGRKTEVKTDFRNSKARAVVKCIIDEDGKRLFADADAEELGRKSARIIDQIFKVVRRLSGMELATEEELEKNSDAGQPVGLPSS